MLREKRTKVEKTDGTSAVRNVIARLGKAELRTEAGMRDQVIDLLVSQWLSVPASSATFATPVSFASFATFATSVTFATFRAKRGLLPPLSAGDHRHRLRRVAPSGPEAVPALWSARMVTRKVPSAQECRFCDITAADCPDRIDGEIREEGITSDC